MSATEAATGTYRVSVERSFIAQHFLTVPNPGPEGELHSHQFRLQVTFSGDGLNEYGYLVDIDAIKEAMDAIVDTYGDETLNELPPFSGLNPSVEHFSRIVCEEILESTAVDVPTQITVRLWEDDEAYASFTTEI
ncbi:6-carboxytetrahydropterin synthase [Halorubraceae archaeon YAN]|nr:6-carboxytetrahydropterin synthase [Halorubraceae archaeon YAN]